LLGRSAHRGASKPLRQLDFASLSEMCFWGAKVLHFCSVELAQSQNVPLVSWPQLLASAFTAGKTRIMMTCDSESLDTLLRTLERSKDLRKQRETLSSVSLTCFGGVSSDLPFKAIQILQHHGIIAEKYGLSPHSVNLFVPVGSREAAVKALHSLI
jgi:aspartokinase